MNGRGCCDRSSTPRTRREDFSFSLRCVRRVLCVERTLMAGRPLVIKFGGELIEDGAHLSQVVAAVARIVATGTPLVVVHGGGKEIDAALKVAGIEKRQVD